jgi:probable F420-dependent oxidoreductase
VSAPAEPDTVAYGVLLPHFGRHATPESVIDDAVRIENWGFDSIWVRDHLVFHPHEYEDQNRTFVDPIVALSAIAARTERITLATGSLIPHRNPIHTALLVGSLDFVAGPGRLLIGWGLGTYQHEFDAIGNGDPDRRELLPEQIEIMRELWTGAEIDYHGKFYDFTEVQIAPVPALPVPTWYCGTSLAAVRRAVEYCDGWIPGRMPRTQFSQRVARMQRLADEAGKPLPDTGVIPWISPARTVAEGRRAVDLDQLLEAAAKKGYGAAAGGAAQSLDDLAGSVIAGPPDVIAEEVQAFHDVGARHVVFDLRARFADWSECIALIGEEVLPLLGRTAPALEGNVHD